MGFAVPVLLYIGSSILAHESPGDLDFFSQTHRNRQPVVLCDGTGALAARLYARERRRLA